MNSKKDREVGNHADECCTSNFHILAFFLRTHTYTMGGMNHDGGNSGFDAIKIPATSGNG
jgi:hypothetical protein